MSKAEIFDVKNWDHEKHKNCISNVVKDLKWSHEMNIKSVKTLIKKLSERNDKNTELRRKINWFKMANTTLGDKLVSVVYLLRNDNKKFLIECNITWWQLESLIPSDANSLR